MAEHDDWRGTPQEELDTFDRISRGNAEKLIAEVERLKEVLRQTHLTYCTSDWTDRGLHAPECLLHEVDNG